MTSCSARLVYSQLYTPRRKPSHWVSKSGQRGENNFKSGNGVRKRFSILDRPGGRRILSLGSPGQFRRTRVRLRRTRPALAGKLWQGNAFALRAREVWLIASNARSGLAPLPSVLPEVANRPPIISRSSPAKLETMIPSPPRLRAWMRVFHWRRFPPFLSP